MKNKILFISLIIIIMALMIVLGYTNARYYSTASMTGKLDIVQTIGQISLYHPEWVGGYTVLEDGTGVFNVPQIPIEYSNIRYSVTNKVNDNINEEEIQYYIRIVAEDGSDNIPIEYDVYEYDNIANIYNNETGVGYGPFTLDAGTEKTQYYSIRVNYIDYATGIQYLKVQMITKKNDGTLKVISEAPLNMQYTGSNVTAHFSYYLYATDPPQEIGTSQILNIPDNINIDFTNEEQLKLLKVSFPENYIFHDARSQLTSWAESSSVSIPEGNLEEYYIEVYMTSPTVVPIILNYYNYLSDKVDETGKVTYDSIRDEVRVVVNRGITIDFTNLAQLNNLQIPLPDNYVLKGLDGALVKNKFDTSVQIPLTTTDNSHNISIYMNPEGIVTVNVSYYNWRIDNEYSGYLLSKNSIEVFRGTKIDFTDTESLTTLGIPIPSGYTFENAYCSLLDSTGTGSSEYTIPMEGETSAYNIDVVLLGSTITVPVKFYDSSGAEISSTTVDMETDGTYTFTTKVCRTLCPTLGTMKSFTVSIYNAETGNTSDIGNTYSSDSVKIDCNAAYGDGGAYKLKDGGSYIYIKAWW